MKLSASRILCTLAGLTAMVGSQPAMADDSEVFLSSTFTTGVGARPNVLFIMDTSGSMDSDVVLYDPAKTYTGSCDAGYVYWGTTNTDVPPDCTTTTRKFTLANNRCRASYTGMLASGWWNGRAQQLNAASPYTAWVDLTGGVDRKVECEGDNGRHGDTIASDAGSGTLLYARNGNSTSRWTSDSNHNNRVIWSNEPRYSFYSANYINYYYGGGEGSHKTRLDIVKEVAANMIETLEGVNLGLMRYSNNAGGDSETAARGGMVTYPITELTDASRAEMSAQVDAWVPGGYTPLSETFYEAHQYLSGGDVQFGEISRLYPDNGGSFKSVAGSRTGNDINSKTYQSPMLYSCQKTFIVYLTDGLPTQDTEASSAIEALPDFATDGFVSEADGGGGEKCPANGPDGDPSSDPEDGRCMVNLAGYMFNHDMRSGVLGKQNVTTYIVGFGSGIAASADYLEDIAKAGGGKSYTQTDAAGLSAALEEIFADVAENANSTFVSPTVAVNAFNRTRNLNTLFVSVFAPTNRAHWPGNVKKYQIINGEVHGASTTTPAVDEETGFFDEGTSDLFNNTGDADGADVAKGGAAVRLPAWDARNVYTYMGTSADLTADANKFRVENTAITNEMIGLSTASLKRQEVIEFTLGRDVRDDDADLDYTETRKAMGDPMHSRPAVVIYGGTETAPVGTVYATTNDGMLQALDMTTGAEQWSFIPSEMLGRLNGLHRDAVTAARSYGVDGDVRIFKYDVDGDGIVETGDKVYAMFGSGRGGSVYYALDITSRTAPRFLWQKTNADLPALGQAWSAPVITRVNVGSTLQSDPQKVVAIFGAGYDTSQENYVYTTDGVGNGVYMLELATGNLLWSAGFTSSSADFKHPFMKNSIPSEITVLDMNGDSFADRMYFGDMGGRIWRLDVWHGQAPANLVSGGLLANLGAGHLTGDPDSDAMKQAARRFYYAPDVSLVTPRGSAPFLNIAIGSGYRGHPLDTDIRDRFYSIRDYQPFNRRTNTSFNSPWVPITDDALVNVTTDVSVAVPDGSNGWKIELAEGGTDWRGEKVLGESITVSGVIFFPTFTPTGADPDNPCLAATLNRTWAVYLDSARPYPLRDGMDPDDPDSRHLDGSQGGIAPGTSVVQIDGETIYLKGVETHGGPQIDDVTRTFWERRQ